MDRNKIVFINDKMTVLEFVEELKLKTGYARVICRIKRA